MRPPQVILGAAVVIAFAGSPHATQAGVPQSTAAREATARPAPDAQSTDARHMSACDVSEPTKDRPPDDPHASSFVSSGGIWYANKDRTLWAWWWGQRSAGDYKVLWVRPAGAQLKIAGRRVDGEAGPLTANIPDGYPWTFQASALAFPAHGCWRVEATAGTAELAFVVRIP